MKILKHAHILGGAFLVAGTSIGAGMLALPIVSAMGGFFPAIVVYLICFSVMTATGLLYLEIALDMRKDSNIISMASRYLGRSGKVFSWIIYLFLFYCLLVAYISGGGAFIQSLAGDYLSLSASALIFTILFSIFVYVGALAVDRLNVLLIVGLAISYFLFIFFGIDHVDFSNLLNSNSKAAIFSFPVILVSFGYQGIIPTLTYYMKKDYKKIRLAIISGTSLAFFVYLVWEFLILGIIPLEGKFGLKEAFVQNQDAIQPLKYYTNIKGIYYIGQFFSFFAVTTSFLGVSLGLFDFIADGFKIQKKGMKKLLIALITFLPPVVITLINPKLFLTALNYAGGIGGALLLVLLPTIMVYSKRYIKKEKALHQLFGGKPILFIICVFVVFVLFVEVFQEINRILS
ncbi:MAG: Tyrosine-specific transport protein [Candidatus Anoxychlamydiales bacterium]|nr:Tyrosine-specific transport protein [Candidatus Anoxychlamydiales bacterium]